MLNVHLTDKVCCRLSKMLSLQTLLSSKEGRSPFEIACLEENETLRVFLENRDEISMDLKVREWRVCTKTMS